MGAYVRKSGVMKYEGLIRVEELVIDVKLMLTSELGRVFPSSKDSIQ